MGHRAVFTHNDLDGLTCALLARVAMPDTDVYFCEYTGLPGTVRARLDRYEVMWFTDLSLRDTSLFDDLEAAGCDVYWFDHHQSSTPQAWMRECRIDLSGEACAADVVRRYLAEQDVDVPVPLETLIDYTRDQDLWIRKIPEAQDFNDILGHLTVQELFDDLSADLGRVYHWSDRMRRACEQTQEARQRSLDLAEATTTWADLPAGHRLRACCCWGSVNEVADALGDERTLVVLTDLRQVERGVIKFSFRTRSETLRADLIAEHLGGGGHARASGAPLQLEVLQALTSDLSRRVQEAAEAVAGDPSCG